MTDHFRGHEILEEDGSWSYADTGEPVVDRDWCGHCGKRDTVLGHDACLGYVPGAMAACCGHGHGKPWIQFWDGRGLWDDDYTAEAYEKMLDENCTDFHDFLLPNVDYRIREALKNG